MSSEPQAPLRNPAVVQVAQVTRSRSQSSIQSEDRVANQTPPLQRQPSQSSQSQASVLLQRQPSQSQGSIQGEVQAPPRKTTGTPVSQLARSRSQSSIRPEDRVATQTPPPSQIPGSAPLQRQPSQRQRSQSQSSSQLQRQPSQSQSSSQLQRQPSQSQVSQLQRKPSQASQMQRQPPQQPPADQPEPQPAQPPVSSVQPAVSLPQSLPPQTQAPPVAHQGSIVEPRRNVTLAISQMEPQRIQSSAAVVPPQNYQGPPEPHHAPGPFLGAGAFPPPSFAESSANVYSQAQSTPYHQGFEVVDAPRVISQQAFFSSSGSPITPLTPDGHALPPSAQSDQPLPYPGGPYPPNGGPYPPNGAPYPPNGVPFAPNGPYPPNGAPYPPNGAPYPPAGAPYPPAGAPYPPSDFHGGPPAPIPIQPYPGQPYPGLPYPGQPYPGQPYPVPPAGDSPYAIQAPTRSVSSHPGVHNPPGANSMPPQPVAPMRNTLTFMQSALPAPMEISGFNASTSDLSIQSVSPPEPPISEMTPSASYHVEKELMDHSAEFNMIENARPTFETLTRARRTATEKKPSTMTPEQELELLKIRSQSGENDDIFEYAKFCATYIPSNNDSKLRDKVAEEGFRLLKKLSKEDYAEAQYWLGRAYSEDDSHNLAFAQFLLAAKRDHPGATFAVGVCYEGGKGSRKDPKAAMTFYRKAAAAAYPPAMYRMGMICLRGELGQKRDIRDGVKWLKRCAAVADTDNPHALMQLSILHETGLPPAVHTDHKYSLQLLMQAANLGFPPAQFRLGQCYEYGSLTCVVDPRESLRWYTVAAEAGEQEAQFALAGWFLTGHLDQIPKDERAALMWTEKAAQAGFPKAQYAMGFFYETGLSILPPDQARAKQWYEIAAANGDERAHQRLTGQPITGSSKRPSKDSKQGSCTIM